MDKPTVRFSKQFGNIVVGDSATVLPIDHPSPRVSNTKPCYTSMVVKVEGDMDCVDRFETLNTKYVRDESGPCSQTCPSCG